MDSENGNPCQHKQCRTHHSRGGNAVCGTVENWIASSKKITTGVNKIDCSGRACKPWFVSNGAKDPLYGKGRKSLRTAVRIDPLRSEPRGAWVIRPLGNKKSRQHDECLQVTRDTYHSRLRFTRCC